MTQFIKVTLFSRISGIKHINACIREVFSLKKNEKLRMSEKNEVFESIMREDIKEYNKLVSRLKGFFVEQAIRTLIVTFGLKGIKNEYGEIYAPNYLDIPSDVREYAEIIADLSLYKNCTELLCNDSRLAFIIYSEGGGSGGRWPYFWHTEWLSDHDDVKEDLKHLFGLVERIITSLDKEKTQGYRVPPELCRSLSNKK
jgi:hypothetical protein